MKKIVKNKVDKLVYREGMEDTIEIFDIVVRSERGKGIGKSMIEEMISLENPFIVYAFTRKTNEIARAFYKAIGFIEIKIPRFYKGDPVIMVIYENSLYSKIPKD